MNYKNELQLNINNEQESKSYTDIMELCDAYNYEIIEKKDRLCFVLRKSVFRKKIIKMIKNKDDKNKKDENKKNENKKNENKKDENKDDDNKDDDNIAIMMTGLPRFYDYSIKSIKSFSSNYKNVDYFFTFWDINGKINNHSKYKYDISNYFERNTISVSTIENIFIHFQPTMLQFLKYSEYETEIIKLSNMINVPGSSRYGHETYKNMVVSVSLINHIGYKSLEEILTVKKFNYFFKIRPDSIINDHVDLKLFNNNLITPLSNSHNLYIDNVKFSMNDQICFTDNFNYLSIYCNLYENLIEVYKLIHNIKGEEPQKYFHESLIGYFIRIMNKMNVKEIPIQTGLVRENKILFYYKDKWSGPKIMTYEEYEKMIK